MFEITEKVKKIILKGSVLENEPMSVHTTFRTGGPARYFVRPADAAELEALIKFLSNAGEEYFILGNGSNLLVSDRGYDGVVIDLGSNDGTEFSLAGIEDDTEDGSIIFDCGAGCLMSAVSRLALRFEASGFERLGGIPGCIGGACIMNAGAYGAEMKDVVTSVDILSPNGERRLISAGEAEFGYRHSRLMDDGSIVLRAELKLMRGDRDAIESECREYAGKRREKQPLEYPSAGSTFKRPEGYFAGKLIEDAGLKGYRIGAAEVSEKHCGFIINRGGCSSSDIFSLIRHVQNTVFDSFGVKLEPEVRMLGEFGEKE